MRAVVIYRNSELTFLPAMDHPTVHGAWIGIPMHERFTPRGMLFSLSSTFQATKDLILNDYQWGGEESNDEMIDGILVTPTGRVVFVYSNSAKSPHPNSNRERNINFRKMPIGDVSWGISSQFASITENITIILNEKPELTGLEVIDLLGQINHDQNSNFPYETLSIKDIVKVWEDLENKRREHLAELLEQGQIP